MFLSLTDEQKLKLQGFAGLCKGIPYVFGAQLSDLSVPPSEVKALDCSEYTRYLFYQIGYQIPDGSYNQFDASEPTINIDIGDLVFKSVKGKIEHVGMIISVVDETLITEASRYARMVVIRPFSDFKLKPGGVDYAGARRLVLDKVKTI